MGGQLKGAITLRGAFSLQGGNENEIPIAASKVQAMLALLATSPNGLRTRYWLQQKLWSDRGSAQAAGSLRQALTQLRHFLRAADIGIRTTRRDVQIDLDTVEVVDRGSGEFLEGIDVRDPEFIKWLIVERRARHSFLGEKNPSLNKAIQSPRLSRLGLPRENRWRICIFADNSDSANAWFEKLFCDAMARSLRESLNVPISVATGEPTNGHAADGLIEITAKAERIEQNVGLRVTLTDTSVDDEFWVGSRSIPLSGGPPIEHPAVLGLVCELSDAVLQFIHVNLESFSPHEPDLLCIRAIDDLFSIDRDRISNADELFAQAYDTKSRGLYLAWQAQLRTVQVVERYASDAKSATEEAVAMAAKAIEIEPRNSMVAALAANVAGHLQKNIERSIELGLLSVRLNPANPMSGNALSSGHLYSEELELSYRQANESRNLALLSKHRFWWDQQLFGSAFVMGKLQESLRLAQTAHALNPNFRPALRYLIALSAHFGQLEEASGYARKLSQIETDFTVEQLLVDHNYPSSLIRRAPGLKTERLKDLF